MNVLFLCLSQNVLPRRVLRAPELGSVTVVTEPNSKQDFGPHVDVRFVEDARDTTAMRQVVRDVLRRQPLDRILAPFERGVVEAGYLRSCFGIAGPGFETSLRFADKHLMKRRLTEAGLPTAAFRIARSLDDLASGDGAPGWPVVVKPVLGGGFDGEVVVLRDADEHRRFLNGPGAAYLRELDLPLIIEECLDVVAEYHCDGIVHAGRVVFASPSRYFTPVLRRNGDVGSYCLPETHPDRTAVLDLHERAVTTLGLTDGATHLEVLRTTDGRLVIGEIACRLGGGGLTRGVELQYGVDLWRAYLEASLGIPPVIRAVREPHLVAHYYLPVRPGRIVEVSDPADLAVLPSVLDVEMRQGIGDVLPNRLSSSAASGIVYFGVRSEAEIAPMMCRIRDRYVFRTAVEQPATGGSA